MASDADGATRTRLAEGGGSGPGGPTTQRGHDWHSETYVRQWVEENEARAEGRRAQLDLLADVVPYPEHAPLSILGVGAGWGPVTRHLLDRFPAARATLLDRDELYDLGADPTECRNLIEDPGAAELRDALHDQLIDWRQAVRDPFRGPAWERRPWRRRPPRLTHSGGWQGRRLGRDDGYSAPYTQEDPFAVRRWRGPTTEPAS